ncbi:hypothetical protein [Streptomyces sp. NPDC005336]|uniref:hypothetical protein n=1 Tax=Streptomyces sp. NPDC005336 TaxID=3157035 RepID=UPI0033B12B53
MNTSADDSPPLENYMCALDLPDGWVNITLASESTSEAAAMAQEIAEEFNPLELKVTKSALISEISRLALDSKKDRSSYAAACYSAAGQNLANVEVDVYGEEGVRLTPAEVQPMLLENKRAAVVGDPVVTYLDQPLGPAVRVQARFKAKGVLGFGRRIIESVAYAVCPTATDEVIVTTMWWNTLALSDDLAAMADSLIPTLRLIPCDAEGNAIPSNTEE